MKIAPKIRSWLGFVLRRARVESEMSEEFRCHLQLRADDLERQGLTRTQAERQARIEFGGLERYTEECREALAGRLLRELWGDMRYGLRQLRRNPGFTAVALATLTLGIGANTAIFSAVDAVLLRPLPFPHPEQLVAVRESFRQFPSASVSYPDYLDWVADNHSFAALSAYRGASGVVTHAGPPAVISGQECTWQYFDVLGMQPELGRTFTAADDRVGAGDVVVIADSLWHQRFSGDPNILGKTMELDATPRVIVGVMPPGFPGLSAAKDAAQYWTPLGAQATKDSGLMTRDNHPGLIGLGRLKPGVTLAAARADLSRIARNLSQQFPKSNTDEGIAAVSYLDLVVQHDGPEALWILLAAVGLLLLIACANVANLLLARAATRQKANAIRSALGASRARLIRGHLTESLCLGVAGSALGLLLAWLVIRATPALIRPELGMPGMARTDQLSLDWRVLAFTTLLALATSLLFGLAPAWHASRTSLAGVLKEGGYDSSAGGSGTRLRGILVAVEMALALVLLAGAGLLIRSLLRLQQVNPGFNPDHVLTFEISLPNAKYPKAEQTLEFFRQARARLARLPGVTAVGTVKPLPFGGNDWETGFTIVGRPEPLPGQGHSTNYAMISGDYFHAMGMRLLRGRAFSDTDTKTSTLVAIIDDTFARRYWPGNDPLANALGKQVQLNGHDCTVVGIVARVMDYGLDQSTEMDRLPESFVPLTQYAQSSVDFAVLTRQADPMQLRGEVTTAIQSLDADQPLDDMMTMNQRIALSLAQRRLTLWLMGAFAVLALILAAIGIYGVLSYAVAQRTHEIGIRMALGAGRGNVLALVLGHGMRLAAAGALAGLAAALPLGRFAASYLFGVSWHDPLTLAAVPLLLLAVAALACYVPARRASRTDPWIALRHE
jgi:putative ABC transport system permease protein